MKQLALFAFITLALAAVTFVPMAAGDQKDDKPWVQLFNGKDLTGWKVHPKSPGKWEVKDGTIIGSGDKPSHLYTDRDDYENFRYRVEAKITDKGNSGQYFRAKFMPGYPDGYEAQINSTHSDVARTGSLYPKIIKEKDKGEYNKIYAQIVVKDQLHKPDEWFTQEVIVEGYHIQIFVNGKKTVDFVDPYKTHAKGHLAIQGHEAYKDKQGKLYPTIITVRKVEVQELRDNKVP